ncbi:MAG: DNA cytosine methyltransferase [Desulfovibrionaceae bacterium]
MSGLIVDLFAGGGGASTGLEWALGRPVDIAINHDAEALAMHRANHPYTRHLCCNILEVAPRMATGGRRVAVLWGSPDCKHFSRAKGGRPRDQAIRSLAWVVVRWAEETRPTVIFVENVPEFLTWGPLDHEGRPIESQVGNTFRAWVRRLRRLGYRVEWRVLMAADYGAATSRRRLFVVARADGAPVWPEATHGPGRLRPHRTAAEIIDWGDPAPSIFVRKKPLAVKTQARLAKGMGRYVFGPGEPFIVVNTSGHAPSGLERPVPTVTTGRQHLLVGPTLVQTGYGERPGQAPRVPGLDKPLGTVVAGGVKHGLMTPVAELVGPAGDSGFSSDLAEASAAWVVKHYGGVTGHGPARPLGAVTAVDHHAVATALLKLGGTGTSARAGEPLHTISAQGQHHGLMTAHLLRYYSNGGQWSGAGQSVPTVTSKARVGISAAFLDQYNGCSQAQPVDEPASTVASMNKLGLVDVALELGGRYEQTRAWLRRWKVIGPQDEAEVTVRGVVYRVTDIGMRMLRPRELYAAQGFGPGYIIAPVHRGKPLGVTSQVRMCGNSVPPQFSEALALANCPSERWVEDGEAMGGTDPA